MIKEMVRTRFLFSALIIIVVYSKEGIHNAQLEYFHGTVSEQNR